MKRLLSKGAQVKDARKGRRVLDDTEAGGGLDAQGWQAKNKGD